MSIEFGLTPSQTVGPYFHYALTPRDYPLSELVTSDMATPDAVGERIVVTGRLLDGNGDPVPDAFLELWQPDGDGRFAGQGRANGTFSGLGRAMTDKDGRYSFTTVKPGAVPGPDGKPQAPHINVGVFARGILRRLFTRMYFDDVAQNAFDPVLALVPKERRFSLIARTRPGGDGSAFMHDIHLQGRDETVFFEA